MDDIGPHPAFSAPAPQPEAVTPGLIGNDNALKRPTRFCGLVPPTLQKPEQRVPIRLKLLQRLRVTPGHHPSHAPRPAPCHEPACLAHLDHHNQGAILLKGSEGSAQVVRLWYGGTSSVLSSDDCASPLAAPIASTRPISTQLSSSSPSSRPCSGRPPPEHRLHSGRRSAPRSTTLRPPNVRTTSSTQDMSSSESEML